MISEVPSSENELSQDGASQDDSNENSVSSNTNLGSSQQVEVSDNPEVKLELNNDSVEEAHEEILDLAGKMLMKGTSPQMVCSCLIAVALRSYMTLMTKEEVVSLLEHIIEDRTNQQNHQRVAECTVGRTVQLHSFNTNLIYSNGESQCANSLGSYKQLSS